MSLRSGHHWLVENNVIHYATTIGLEAGMEWRIGYTDEDAPVPPDYTPSFNVIRNNRITDNGLCGIAALGHVGLQESVTPSSATTGSHSVPGKWAA